MEIKKYLGAILLISGALSLIAGIFGVFKGQQIFQVNPWAYTIIGLFFFSSGVNLIKSIRTRNINRDQTQ